MRIVNIHECTVPISRYSDKGLDRGTLTTSAAAIRTDVVREGRRLVGYGFSSFGRYGQGGLMRERFIPRLLKARPEDLLNDEGDNFDPSRIRTCMMSGEKPGGHGERSVAVGTIDMAVWDMVAKVAEKPLYRLLADKYSDGKIDEHVPAYVAGGYYYPDNDVAQLQHEIRRALDLGYTQVKIKIGSATLKQDMRRIEAVLELVGSGENLSVDANNQFDLQTALRYGAAIKPFGLRWYEDACDPLDYTTQAAIAKSYEKPLAAGEGQFSLQDARNLILYGGLRPEIDYLLFDCVHSYGLVEYLRIISMLEEHGWSRRRCYPHGGHLFSLHMTLGLRLGGTESHVGTFQPFGGFADDTVVEHGYVKPPETPGIGFETKQALWDLLQSLGKD